MSLRRLVSSLPVAVVMIVIMTLTGTSRSVATADEKLVPKPVIFDTDIGNDVDDVVALSILHALQSRGECRLLGVTVTKDHDLAAPFVDAVNTFYGRGDIPIGAVRDGATRDVGKYNVLAHAKDDQGNFRYSHDLTHGSNAPSAVPLLRKLLADQEDGSVAMIQVGFSTNFVRLLDSVADDNSPLGGRDLVRKKVKLLSIMAGAFTPIGNDARYKEYNVVQDIPSAKKLVTEWPTPMVFSGFEIGIAIPYPAESIVRDFRYVAHHPLAEAYWLYSPPPHHRPTWDPTSALYAVRADHGYFGLSEPGVVTVENDGFTRFEPQANGQHRYLKFDPAQLGRVTEAMVGLASQPPCPGCRE